MLGDPANTLVTVFGGSGFLGRNVVHRLARDGYRIRVATRHPSRALHLVPAGKVGQIALVRANVLSDADVSAAVDHADAVINLVGVLRSSGQNTFQALHSDAAERIARAAKSQGAKRLVQISAIGANEESRSAYASTKGEGETRSREAFPEVTIMRPSVVFGPGDGFFNRFASLMRMSALVFPLFGGGQTKFQPVFAGDVAEAVAHAFRDGKTGGRVYELGGPVAYTLKDLLAYIARVTERKRAFLPIPFFMLDLTAALTGWLPFAPVTLDQARLLRVDNVVKAGKDAANVGTLEDLGVQPTSIDAVVPSYLYAYRRTGQYAEPRGV